MNAALCDFSIFGALEKNTYLLTYLRPTHSSHHSFLTAAHTTKTRTLPYIQVPVE